MQTLSQDTRIARLISPLPEGTVGVHRFESNEALSTLSTYTIEIHSTEENIDFDGLLGRKMAVEIATFKKPARLFNGVLVEAEWCGQQEELFLYRLTLRPWLWLLTRTTDCKIFSEQTAPDIVRQVLGEHGFATHEFRTTQSYPTLPYCVQYRESDFDFVSRLMEEWGMYYFFEHSESDHTMVIADARSSHQPLEAYSSIKFRPLSRNERMDEEDLWGWDPRRRFNTGKVTYNDYDFVKPNANLIAENEASSRYAEGKLERYDYPGRYTEQGDGVSLSKVRLEAEQCADKRRTAQGVAPSLAPGGLVSLEKHPVKAENREYLVVAARYAFRSDSFRSGAEAAGDGQSGVFELLPADVPFRAPQVTRKPVIAGAQTAKVVGEGEIDVDEHGQILVQFHWDREDKKSCRLRVAQVWAGQGWGGIYIPRVDQEVIIHFLEGDPDRPICTGCVYNGDNTVPYPLAADKNIAGVKSRSTEDGTGYNEFIFDDTIGDELVRLHAERDLESTIENDERRKVKRDQSKEVDRDVNVLIGRDKTEEIQGKWDNLTHQTIRIEAYQEIKFVCGMSTITMTPGSIDIESPTISINGTGKTDVLSSGITTVKGSLVLIN